MKICENQRKSLKSRERQRRSRLGSLDCAAGSASRETLSLIFIYCQAFRQHVGSRIRQRMARRGRSRAWSLTFISKDSGMGLAGLNVIGCCPAHYPTGTFYFGDFQSDVHTRVAQRIDGLSSGHCECHVSGTSRAVSVTVPWQCLSRLSCAFSC